MNICSTYCVNKLKILVLDQQPIIHNQPTNYTKWTSNMIQIPLPILQPPKPDKYPYHMCGSRERIQCRSWKATTRIWPQNISMYTDLCNLDKCQKYMECHYIQSCCESKFIETKAMLRTHTKKLLGIMIHCNPSNYPTKKCACFHLKEIGIHTVYCHTQCCKYMQLNHLMLPTNIKATRRTKSKTTARTNISYSDTLQSFQNIPLK